MVRRKMGDNQRAVMDMLLTRGPWKRNAYRMWAFGSAWDTERILKTLVRRGDVFIDRAGYYKPSRD